MLIFRTTWSKSLRDYRVPILVWGISLGLAVIVTFASYNMMSEASRPAQAKYAETFRFVGEPVAVNTAAGYVTWHTVGLLPVMLAIWTVLAGARLVRGDEERGEMDILLSAPKSRLRLFAERIAAFMTALLLIAVIMAVVIVVGEFVVNVRVDVGGALLTSLNIALTAMIFGLTAALLAHLFSHRVAAASIAGALVILAYLINATGRTLDNGEWLRRFSPLYYHDLSKPLIPTYGANIGAFILLVGTVLLLAGVNLYAFSLRDIGGVLFPAAALPRFLARPRAGTSAVEQARHDRSLRTPGVRAVRSQLASVIWWMVGLLTLTAWITVIARSAKDALAKIVSGSPALAQLFASFDLANDTGFVAAIVFFYVPVICVLYAMMQAMPWPFDLEHGRMELPLGAPFPRARMYAERFAAVVLACIIAPIVGGVGIFVAAWLANLSLDAGRVSVALFGLLPAELIAAAVVYLLTGWLRLGAVATIVGSLIGISYFAELFNPLLNLPHWLISLSIFHQYGTPLTSSPNWAGWMIVLLIAAVCFVGGAFRFVREDIRGRA